MNFAFIVMGPNFDPKKHNGAFHHDIDRTEMYGVSSLDQACALAGALKEAGVQLIELCGAFGEEGCRRVIEAVKGEVPVGYVVHLPSEDEKFKKLFG